MDLEDYAKYFLALILKHLKPTRLLFATINIFSFSPFIKMMKSVFMFIFAACLHIKIMCTSLFMSVRATQL